MVKSVKHGFPGLLCILAVIIAFSACRSSKVGGKHAGWWGKAEYTGKPWVKNVSAPYTIMSGLQGRHLSVWASHGRYYNLSRQTWTWQRPSLFCTTEDLFTQTFVSPYIIPMLENAGANVFTPRERDWQSNEIIVDNDLPHVFSNSALGINLIKSSQSKAYMEEGAWSDCPKPGFRIPDDGTLRDGDLPFSSGTVRISKTSRKNPSAYAYYYPAIEEEGDYAVYVSYQTQPNSVDDAMYMVCHGDETTFYEVNQRMGGGTWVYLGTFHFTTEKSHRNCVAVLNVSSSKGVVTTDAVRFGGGMGNIVRGKSVSGLPRCDEGARYYCQWAGAPADVYRVKNGTDDYAEDLNSRSLMLNWVAGGSSYVPATEGLGVPLEMNLAFHSDAGYFKDFKSIFGSLGIVTTNHKNGILASGVPRTHNVELRDSVLSSVARDMKRLYGTWHVRDLYDKNYSETRIPEVPSIIFEMLSHQSFPDMRLAHDPLFKFNLSRAVYKAVLKHVAVSHKSKAIITPLAPKSPSLQLSGKGKVILRWEPQYDALEPDAVPTSYLVRKAVGTGDFDNGTVVKGTSVTLPVEPGVVSRYRILAVNDGGVSFPSEELAVVYRPGAPVVMVVNGFHRLASPQVVDAVVNDSITGKGKHLLGFDITKDPGVSYGRTAGWSGNQVDLDVATASSDADKGIFGYSDNSLEGRFIAGNDFNYATTHVMAIAQTGAYSAVSCSATALGDARLDDYAVLDVILGNERDDGYSLYKGKALTPLLMSTMRQFRGPVLVSGSYIGSDSQDPASVAFLRDILHLEYKSQNRDLQDEVHGMGMEFGVYRNLNDRHYASTSSDVLAPSNGGFPVMQYADNTTSAIASSGQSRRTFAMGFPFECIKEGRVRSALMSGILRFLTQNDNR